MGKDRMGKLGSGKLLVPTKDRKGVEEVDVSKLTSEHRNIIVDQVLEVKAFLLSDSLSICGSMCMTLMRELGSAEQRQ